MAAATLYVIAGLLTLGAVYLVLRGVIGDRAKGRKRCPKCWYDMRAATTLVCPECGNDAGSESKLLRTRRSFRAVGLAVLILCLGDYIFVVANRVRTDHESTQNAFIPTTAFVALYPYLDAAWQDAASERIGTRRHRVPVAWAWQGDWFVATVVRVLREDKLPRRTQLDRVAPAVLAFPRSGWRLGDAGLFEDYMSSMDRVRVDGMLTSCIDAGESETILPMLIKHCGAAEDLLVRYLMLECALPAWERLSDDALIRAVDCAVPPDGTVDLAQVDRPLRALAKRPAIAKRKLAELHARVVDFWPASNAVAILSLLRQAEGRPSPLEVRTRERAVRWARGMAPVIHAELLNVDVFEPEAVRIQFGRDSSGPRLERWRIEVRGSDASPHFAGITIDSIRLPTTHGKLLPGETVRVDLQMEMYAIRPPPGTYSVVVQYHDAQWIADRADVSDLILFQSAPIQLIVE